ncbi:MAG: sulfite exporter TauE/SafE family protein [Pseudomonadota bacterium]
MIELALAFVALAIAGFAKGIVGLGLPPIAMGLLVLAMSPVEAAATMVVPALLTNLLQAFKGPQLSALLKRLWLPLLLSAATTLAFAGALSARADIAIAILGVLLLVYGVYSLRTPAIALSHRAERWLGPVSGAATGLVTAFTGVSSMPSVPFLQSIGLGRDAFVQAMGLFFLVSAVALIAALGVSGSFEGIDPASVVVASLAAIGGMAAGSRLRRTLDETLFRRVFLWGLILLGLYLTVRSI